ncbi:Hypothetical predicted protein [Mytilus galloprovincialis]|uniref:Uncharacterized protein n=1 Tax=Mytilus galloprovincialis TaxID=29158 RepID=A0A8B6EG37_MYTGA|nr:Hypothetical predicted protein [Mytilus galloprovincialis]
MNKLSLNKTKKEDILPTQEQFAAQPFEEDEIDLTLSVTNISNTKRKEEDKTVGDFADTISTAIVDLRNKMDTRLAIAKAREGLAYALQTEGNIPPFCRINLSCRPDVTGDIKKTLDNAKEIIGIASQSAGEARKELHKRFIEMKDNQEKTLLEFKTNIRSRTNNTEPKWKKGASRKNFRRSRPY